MSISRVGIIQVVTAGTQSITVPADATYALIFTKYYWGVSPVAVTLGGQSCPVIISGPSSSIFTEVRGLSFPPTGSQTLVSGAAYASYPCVVIFYSGVNLFDPIVSAATSVTVDTDITGMSHSPGDMMVGGVSGYYTSPVVTDAAQTQIFLETSHGFGIAEKVSTGDFYYTMESGDYTPVAVVLRNMVLSTLDQYSFRLLNDDGSESAATFAGPLNGDITLPPGSVFRFRALIDATDDPTGKQFQLEYSRKPSGGSFGSYKKVI